jgi:hypothetical protein
MKVNAGRSGQFDEKHLVVEASSELPCIHLQWQQKQKQINAVHD